MTPEREKQIRQQTPPRDHVDCGERAEAIWDLLDEVELLRSALAGVFPYAESRVEDMAEEADDAERNVDKTDLDTKEEADDADAEWKKADAALKQARTVIARGTS